MDDHELRAIYDGAVGNRIAWLFSAHRLKEAAALVFAAISEHDRDPPNEMYVEGFGVFDLRPPEGSVPLSSNPDLRGVYLYLASLAIENLLKGLWMRANVVAGGKLPREIAHHDLDALATAVGVTFDADERTFVDLAETALNLGRFPGPRSWDDPLCLPDDLNLNKVTDAFQRLYERLIDLLMDGVNF